ncbi:S-layer homology domain-containing protein [Solibacillus cecembensis]|uniref:S-layer homology domain-containing protein n=1 Tax=Solibacillus cecembensis TaxID=459347 RepID=UPI003D0351BA
MAKKSKATKAIIASLLATSAIVPAMAVSADVDGSVKVNGTDATSRSVEAVNTSAKATKTIDFKVEDATGMLAKYVPGTGSLVEREGQKYIQLNLTEQVLAMVDEVLVDGKTAVYNYGSKMILIPVSADFKPVEATFTLTTPVGKMDAKAILTPDPASIKQEKTESNQPTKPEEEAGKPFAPGKKFDSVADGIYDVTFDTYAPETNIGNYKAISSHFSPKAKLIVKGGKYSVQVEVVEKSNPMIAALKVNEQLATTVSGSATEGTRVLSFDINSISDLHKSAVHVVVPAAKMDKWYDFGFAINTANLELPKAETKPEANTLPAFVYADGKNDLSIMQGKYLADQVTVTATAGGYDVDVTFPEGQHLNDFTVTGATVAKKSEEIVGENTVKIYTVSVKDITQMYNATVDLSVRFGDFKYDEKYPVQLQFGGKKNPFTDIMKDASYGSIVSLYSKGIFKEADKFNPKNNVTRSQFALMINRALTLEVPATTKFTDIAKFDAETQSAIKALNGIGVINGNTETLFAPTQDISRKQAALMIYRLLEKQGYKATGATANFSDVSAKDVEVVKAIAELNKLGVMTGYEGKFNPDLKLTRGQMAKVLNNGLTVIDGLK